MYQWLKSGSLKRPISGIEEDNTVNDMNEVQCTDQPSSSDSNRRIASSKSTVVTKVRKYNTEYLQLRFTFAGNEDEPKPQCIICLEILSNGSMKPSKLRRHFEPNLDEIMNKKERFDSSHKVRKSMQ